MLPLKKLDPHPLNSNEHNDISYHKLLENINRTGRYPALIVRKKGDRYEIIDGYWRSTALKELGYTEAKCEIWDIDDKESNLLLATLNRLRGTDDTGKRAVLLKQLDEDFGKDIMYGLLPEAERAINGLLKMVENQELTVNDERGVLEEKMLQSGIEAETAKGLANMFQAPSDTASLRFVFDDESAYNKAIKYFGLKPDYKKLIELIEKYANSKT